MACDQPRFLLWGRRRTLIANPAFHTLFGPASEAEIGGPIGETRLGAHAALAGAVGRAYRGEAVTLADLLLAPGTPDAAGGLQLAVSLVPVPGPDGVIEGLFGSCEDITERQRAARDLKKAEARFRAIQEASPDGFMILDAVRDPEGTILDFRWAYANPAAERIVGKSRTWFVGKRLLEEMPGNRETGLFAAYVDVVETDRPFVTELAYIYEGLDVHLRLTATRVGDGFAVAFSDLTEQRRSEARLARAATAVDKMGEGFLVLDRDLVVQQINREGLRLDGRAEAEIVGRPLLEVWPEADALPTLAAFRSVLADGRPVELAYRHPRDSGAIWLEVRAYPTPDGLAVFYRDVTARVEIETRLQEASERLRLALDAGAIVGAWLWDVPRDRFTADDRFADTFGLDIDRCRRGLALDQVMQAIHPDDHSRVSEAIASALAQGGGYRCAYRVRQGDGFRWVEAIGRVEHDDAGAATRFPGVLLDIGERRAVEMERDRVTDLLRTFSEAVPGVVYAKDAEGRMLVANRGASDLIGLPPEDILGRTDVEFLSDADEGRRIMATDQQIMAGGVAQQLEETITRADGSQTVWLSTKAPMRNPAGDIVGLVGSSIDITSRKHTEAALEASREALARLNATLEERVASAVAEREQALDALRQSHKLESMGQITGGVAHDFNNLLTPILGSLDMLQRRGVGDAREQRLIEGALQSAERARILVQRLLAFARRQPLQAVTVDVGELIQGMADLVASTCGPRVQVVLDAPLSLDTIRADRNQLEMAVLNLAVNARDAMPDGGVLTLSASARPAAGGLDAVPGWIDLSITDTGAGMDPDTLARAIEPFFSTKGIGQGTGLGLSMAHGLAAQLGGSLHIDSTAGAGTKVTFRLPVCDHVEPTAAPPPSRAIRLGSGVCLVVDDEPHVRRSTADMLSELGYTVREAETAEAALEMIAGGVRPRLVVTDHLMPGMSGTVLAQTLRRSDPRIAVLIVSGYAEATGIDPDLPRLTKPFRQAELAEALAAL